MHRPLALGLLAVPFALSLIATGAAGAPTSRTQLKKPAAVAALPAAARASAVKGWVPPAPPASPVLSDYEQQRAQAATATAQSSSNACAPIRPFYWEVGDATAKKVSGSVMLPGNATKYSATIPMSIASASKWIYGTYVAQARGGALSAQDRQYLAMRAGYTSFTQCEQTDTVASCAARGSNDDLDPDAVDRFFYSGGHMEQHALLMGLGSKNNSTLATAVKQQVGTDIALMYTQPQLAGGLAMSPDAYARVLRKILGGSLHMGGLLGSGAVCTNPTTCGLDNAVATPIPDEESWEYSVGHWVESDPVQGDGAFSSPGAFGFYPWIDAEKTSYGVLARIAPGGAFASVQCGRLIRKAWATAVAQ